jgi:hypothetical protein
VPITSDKLYQLLAHDRWFSPGTPVSSTTKTGCHDIVEILLKVALNTIIQSINQLPYDHDHDGDVLMFQVLFNNGLAIQHKTILQ